MAEFLVSNVVQRFQRSSFEADTAIPRIAIIINIIYTSSSVSSSNSRTVLKLLVTECPASGCDRRLTVVGPRTLTGNYPLGKTRKATQAQSNLAVTVITAAGASSGSNVREQRRMMDTR